MPRKRDDSTEWEQYESWGIRPYNPDMDCRDSDDVGRTCDERDYARNCTNDSCFNCRLAPIAELAEDRDTLRYTSDAEERIRLFASGWAVFNRWRKEESPELMPGSTHLLGDAGRNADRAIRDLTDVGILRPILRRQILRSDQVRDSEPGRSSG